MRPALTRGINDAEASSMAPKHLLHLFVKAGKA